MPEAIQKPIGQIKNLIVAGSNPVSSIHALRTTVAAVGLIFQPWIATAGTLLGSSVGDDSDAILAGQFAAGLGAAIRGNRGRCIRCRAGGHFLSDNVRVFGLGILMLGMVSSVLKVDRTAYRYAGITMVIVMLATQPTAPWMVAFHRFFEVGLGILVGLVLSAVWSERGSTE